MLHPKRTMSRNFYVIPTVILIVIAGITLVLSFFVSIYTDDIQYPLTALRAGYDGWRIISPFPTCSNSFGTPIPFTLFPGRFLAWLIYYPISTPIVMRLFGISCFVGWIFFLSWMSRKSFNVSWPQVFPIIISLSFLGTLPFMGTLMRSETTLSIVVTLYALLPFYMQRCRYNHTALIICYLLVSSWFFSTHPKTVFFAPLALYVLWYMIESKSVWQAALLMQLGIIGQAYNYWNYRFTCPDSPWAQSFILQKALSPGFLLAHPLEFIQKLINGISTSSYYFHSILFAASYGSGWLPPMRITVLHKLCNFMIGGMVLTILFFWAISAKRIATSTWKNKKFLDPDFAVPFLLFSCMLLTVGFQQLKDFYDVMLIWFSGVCLTIILFFRAPLFLSQPIRNYLIIGFGSIATLSQIVLIYSFWRLPEINQNADVNGALKNQPMSATMLNYDIINKRITEFAAKCDIHFEYKNSHLIIDMFTYLPFKSSFQPEFVKHIDNKIIPFAKEHHSEGLITLCTSLPKDAQNISIKDNGLCCISKNFIDVVK